MGQKRLYRQEAVQYNAGMKKGAIFDMDGLLIDSEAVYHMFWKKEAEERGIVLDPAFLVKISGSSRDKGIALISHYYPGADSTEVYESCIRRTAQYCQKYVEEKPGAHELLAYLKAHGVKTAVASSSVIELVRKNLKRLNLLPYFDALTSGTEVEKGKPAPDIFLKAAEKLGLSGRDCYVFEDAYNGVRAGHAAGCFTVMVPDMVQPDDEMKHKADAICSSLYEVKEKMERGEW